MSVVYILWPFILMLIGAASAIWGIRRIILYIFRPFYEDYQVVIKREDDYAHYTSPSNYAYLQSKIKRYLATAFVAIIIGLILLFVGAYIEFGPRGLNILFNQGITDTAEERLYSDLPVEVNPKGNNICVRGDEIYYQNEYVGDTEAFAEYVNNLDFARDLYLIDSYATSATFKEVIRILNENGIFYELVE